MDGTPDSSHTEQTTFILRYMKRDGDVFSVQERFLVFVDCCNKTGVEIASLILETLQKYEIPIADCRGQGYDNAANMSGKYNGAQIHIKSINPLSLYSPCACHSLNLCGADSAKSCMEAVTFLEWFKLSTAYSPAALSDGRFCKATLAHHCMVCLEQGGQIVLQVCALLLLTCQVSKLHSSNSLH